MKPTSRRRSAALTTAALTLLVAGCASSPARTGPATSEPAPTNDVTASDAVEPASPTAEPVDAADVIAGLEISRSDLPAGYGPNLMQAGDEVSGQVTLDVCGASYPSEALRTARHQVAYALGDPESPGYDRTGDGASVGSEVVSYSPGGAEQALAEIRDAIATCPRGFVPSVVASVPPLQSSFDPIRPASDWQDDHVAVLTTVRSETGESFRMAAIYQRHGDVMAATYAMTAGPDRGIELARRFASVLSERMEGLPDPVPNA